MPRVFVFPKGHNYAGKSVLLMGRYKFVNGVMLEEDDERAKMMTANLVDFYCCQSMDHEKFDAKAYADSVREPAKVAPAQSGQGGGKAPPGKDDKDN